MARIARATATDNSTAVPEYSAQSIELVDYPTVPRARSHPAQAGSSESAREPAHRAGRKSIDRLRFADWEHKVPPKVPEPPSSLVKFWAEALRRRSQFPRGNEKEPKMKFSHSLQFNAVPDWSAYYIAYSNLKKLCVLLPFARSHYTFGCHCTPRYQPYYVVEFCCTISLHVIL